MRPTTLQKYQSHFKNQILPHLGDVKIQELTPAMLEEEWIRELQACGLSKATLSSIHTLMHNALNHAVHHA